MGKMKASYLMVLYLLVVLFPMGVNAQGVETADSNMLTYENISYGIAMKYPEDWTVTQRSNAVAIFVAPPNGIFENAAYIFVEDLYHSQMTLDLFTDDEIQKFEKSLKDFHLLDRNKTLIAGQPANEIVLTWKMQHKENGQIVSLTTHAIYIVLEDRAYILSYTAESNKYQEYLRDVLEMFQSFEVLSQRSVESSWPTVKINSQTTS